MWKKLKDISINDIILTTKIEVIGKAHKINFVYKPISNHARNVKTVNIPQETTSEFMKILGFYIGDGSRNKLTVYFHIFNTELEVIYRKLLEDCFLTNIEKNRGTIYICSVVISKLFEFLGVCGHADTKRVPSWIFGLPKEQIEAFIKGYLDADGTFYIKTEAWKLSSINRELLKDIKKLCNIIGVRTASINKTDYSNTSNRFSKKPLYDMRMQFDKKYAKSLVGEISRKTKINGRTAQEFVDRGFEFEKVLKKEFVGQKGVYDIMTDNENHNFVANNIIAHNSFQELVSGRDQDYFVDNINSMIYISRLFLLPAAYGLQGRYFIFGAGEYKRAIQLEYSYGRNPSLDYEQFPRVQDAATKLAAVDILTMHDYSQLVSSGTDRITLESKINQFKADIEENLDQLTGLAIW